MLTAAPWHKQRWRTLRHAGLREPQPGPLKMLGAGSSTEPRRSNTPQGKPTAKA